MDRDHSYNKEDLAKYTIKDSVFTSLFSDKKYIVQLYEALHPEQQMSRRMTLLPLHLRIYLWQGSSMTSVSE